jgi:hypothetical protein
MKQINEPLIKVWVNKWGKRKNNCKKCFNMYRVKNTKDPINFVVLMVHLKITEQFYFISYWFF